MVSEVRYHPYGQERWSNGATPTDFGFTSQRNEASFGLMDYNARYYSPVLGRFISPDTIVPEPTSSGGFNRYRYVRNNPLRYTDPSGHCVYYTCEEVISSLVTSYAEVVSEDTFIATGNVVHQINSDVDIVFSNAPVGERVGPAFRVGIGSTVAAAITVETATGLCP